MIKKLWDNTVGGLFRPNPDESNVLVERHTLSEWEGFMLACIQLQEDRLKSETGQLYNLPYTFVQKIAVSRKAPHTSCQKIKEGFDSLERKGLIHREPWPYNRVRLVERLESPYPFLLTDQEGYENLIQGLEGQGI